MGFGCLCYIFFRKRNSADVHPAISVEKKPLAEDDRSFSFDGGETGMDKDITQKPFEGKLKLPDVGQIGVVVKDLDKAVDYYSSMFGIGPFKYIERHYDGVILRERNDASYSVRIAIAPMGSVDFELIQITEGESIHLEFLEKKGEGIEHLGFRVPDLDAEIARFKECGIEVLQSARRSDGGGYAYMDTENIGGIIFELIQQHT